MTNTALMHAIKQRKTLEYKKELEDIELFHERYISFDSIDREFFNSCVHIGCTADINNIVDLEKTRLTGVLAEWCKEHKINYRKIKVETFKITDAKGNPVNWGQTQYGMYFSNTEDAVAFKLRWC